MEKLSLPKFDIPVLKEKQLPPEIFYEQIVKNIKYLYKSGRIDRILKQPTRRPVNSRFIVH